MNSLQRFISFLILLQFISLNPEETYAGGWAKKKGKFYLQLSSQYMSSNKFHNINGKLVYINAFSDFTLSLYGEYGITDDVSIVAFFPFFHRLTLDENKGNSGSTYFAGAKKSGVSDFDIGIKYKIAEGRGSVLSLGFSLGLPLGDSNDPNGLLTGDDELNQKVGFQFGHSFYPVHVYFNASAAYNLRHKGYSDEIDFGIEAGYTFNNKLLVTLRITGLKPLHNGNNNIVGAGGLFSNNQQYIAYGPELFYNVTDNWGITAGMNSGTWARNVLSAKVFRVGFFIQN